jgi:sarcosine oxidase subunit gamma
MSCARAAIDLVGPGWREVLAKGSPIDLAPGRFEPGDFRRTRLGQVAVAIWASEAETAHLVCFRSVAGFVFDWLRTAAAPGSLPGLWTRG